MISQSLKNREWDVIIIGTGMGGATLGYALAMTGRHVLFLEKGRSYFSSDDTLVGNFAETFFVQPEAPAPKHAAILARAGRWCNLIEDRTNPRPRTFIPLIGAGTGGSSALYGMALERFHPTDFTPKLNYPEEQEADLPVAWPISYTDLRTYYRQAEALYGVRGTLDPLRVDHLDALREPTHLSPSATEFYEFLKSKGLHPYRLPMASRLESGCLGCQGFLCQKKCKNDSARVCLIPTLERHRGELLDECRVLRLEAGPHRVNAVTCQRHGEEFKLHGQLIILAAGALETPCILLRSVAPDWPQGLANESGLVGRCLMRHYVDLYPISLKAAENPRNSLKELAFNDFYWGAAGKLGTVQSFGILPPVPIIAAGIEEVIRQGGLPWLMPFFKLAKPFFNHFLSMRLGRSLILASIMEDLPYCDNHVRPTAGADLIVEYRIRPQEAARIRRFRKILQEVFRPYSYMQIKQAENNERIAHACGTCRFGTDPKSSVLDAQNKAHGLDNLYIVDASFFPSSSGMNPALTIAANALRVASGIVGKTGQP